MLSAVTAEYQHTSDVGMPSAMADAGMPSAMADAGVPSAMADAGVPRGRSRLQGR